MTTFYYVLFVFFVIFGFLPAFGLVIVKMVEAMENSTESLYWKSMTISIVIFLLLLVTASIYETIGQIHTFY